MEVHDAVVVEVLARKHLVPYSSRMNIGQWMLSVVPSAKAEIQTADEGQLVIDHDELLMMCPVKSHIACDLKNVVVWVSHDFDVAISWLTFFTERMQCMLGMR